MIGFQFLFEDIKDFLSGKKRVEYVSAPIVTFEEKMLTNIAKTNYLLEQLLIEMKRNSDLVEAHNKAYHV